MNYFKVINNNHSQHYQLCSNTKTYNINKNKVKLPTRLIQECIKSSLKEKSINSNKL